MNNKKPKCHNCAYWEFIPELSAYKHVGQCRKNAPRTIISDGEERIDFAVTTGDSWCGDHPEFNNWFK